MLGMVLYRSQVLTVGRQSTFSNADGILPFYKKNVIIIF